MISTKVKISSSIFSIAIIITYFMQKLDGYYAIEYMQHQPIFALTLILPVLYIIYMILTWRGNEKSITVGAFITMADEVYGVVIFSICWAGLPVNIVTAFIPLLGLAEFIVRRGIEEVEEMKR